MNAPDVQAAWDEWAQRELAAYGDKRATAVDTALDVMQKGLSPQAAAVSARVRAGAPVPPNEVLQLWEEVKTTYRVAEDLSTIQPSGELTQAAIDQVRRHYEKRLEALRPLYDAALKTLPAGPKPRPAAAVTPAAANAPPRPSLREFLADNSILIISVAGAFLLIVATLLFELYGSSGLAGEIRFGGVMALNLTFGAAAYICFGRPRLRIVGQTYLAIFALMAPLTILAAWVFLNLESRGISRELAIGVGGLSCSALYAILALRLGSRGYAALSMGALAAGWAGVVAAAHAGVWMGPSLTALTFAYIAICFPPAAVSSKAAVFTRIAEPFVHAAAALSLFWLVPAVYDWMVKAYGSVPFGYEVPTTFGLLTVAYCLYVWRSRKTWMLWTVWTGASLTVLAFNEPLGFGVRGYVLELAVLAWAYAIGVRWMPGRAVPTFVRAGGAVQAAVPALLNASPDALQAAVLFATAGVGVWLATEGRRRPAWLLLAAGIFAVDWYWLAKALLPPPSQAGIDTLLLVYSPLPALYMLVGLALRLMGRRRWSLPLYAAGAAVGLWVAFTAVTENDLTLAWRALIVYAGAGYVAAALDRWWPGLLAAIVAAAVSVVIVVTDATVATFWYPLALAGVGVAVYAAHRSWKVSELTLTHRYSGLAITGLTAALSFAVPDFWSHGSIGSLAALAALLAVAALVLVEGRLYGRPLLDYVAPAAASLGGFWIARYLGVDNTQAYVVLPGVVLIALGLVAPQDIRRPASLIVCRGVILAGAVALMGTSAYQSLTDEASGVYTVLWVVEAVLAILLGIGARCRTLVLAGGAGLALGALRALFLILETVQVYVVFGAIAIVLLVGAGILAALRDRLASKRSSFTRSWHQWM